MDVHQEHEQKLAAALRKLVEQIDINDYRDSLGHPMKNNIAFIHAQAMADEFCVTHEDICQALDHHDGSDLATAARWLSERAGNKASPSSTPAEYETWRTGP